MNINERESMNSYKFVIIMDFVYVKKGDEHSEKFNILVHILKLLVILCQ